MPSQPLAALDDQIPEGRETARLRRSGFRTWSDLYPERQIASYMKAGEMLSSLKQITPAVMMRLELVLGGAVEMAGFSSRWDRFHLKAFECIANHRYSASPLTVEIDPFATQGRGTLRRRLEHSIRAAEWSRAHGFQRVPALLEVAAASPRVEPALGPKIVIGSSDHQALPDACVKMVLTDPPYFDDVQYGELSLLFLAWARQLGLALPSNDPDNAKEAVPNRFHGVAADDYGHRLASIMLETTRTLRPDGAVIITFHNTKFQAWVALGQALNSAGLSVKSLAVVHSENETDCSKRGRKGFSKDLVLECGFGVQGGEPVVAVSPEDDEAKELLAIGLSLASGSGQGEDRLLDGYLKQLPDGLVRRIR
jgi:adenine-specific DNA methylase